MSWEWKRRVNNRRKRVKRRKERRRTHLVLTDHDLLNNVAVSQLDRSRVLERTRDLTTTDQRQPLNTLKVRMLDRHDARLSEERFRVVVDQLTVDEAGDAVRLDLGDLRLHLFLREVGERVSQKGRRLKGKGRTRSARSSSASLPVESTLTRAPKILILSVSIAARRRESQSCMNAVKHNSTSWIALS
jgi:hypothetical protein